MSNQTHRWGFVRGIASRSCSHSPMVALLLVVLSMMVAECVLIERKYGLFSAGFLQAHPITETSDRLLFLVFSLWMDFLFFGVLAMLWNGLLSRLRVHPLWIAYHFYIFAGGVGLVIAGVKYQLLAYFSDTINYSVLHEIGGDPGTMLAYASEKGTLLGLSALVLVIFYLAGVLFIRRLRRRFGPEHPLAPSRRRQITWLGLAGGALVLTAFFHHGIRQSDKLYYGLKEKLSYSSVDKLFAVLARQSEDDWIKAPTATSPLGFTESEGAIAFPSPGAAPPRHLVLVVLESARADLIGKKVNGCLVAPNLQELADKGTCFQQAYCHQAFTIAARYALFTGSLSKVPKERSIFSILKRNGYEVSVFSAMDESFGGCSEATGMEENCTTFFDARQAKGERISAFTASGSLAVDDELVSRVVRGRLRNLDWNRPQFLYINFQSGHYPYHHERMPRLLGFPPIPKSQIGRENRQWVENTYWNAQAHADAQCGEVIQALRQLKVFDNTLVVVVGDHGESLYDDGTLGHGHALNDTQTRIPLIVNVPALQAQQPIGQVDILDLMFRHMRISTAPPSAPLTVPHKAVFQFIGSLQNPVQIGMVESNGCRTILDLRTREVWSSDIGKWLSYKGLEAGTELSQRTERLVAEWRRLRG